jgi:hypothetical protein
MTVCSVANTVCILDNQEGNLDEVLKELKEAAHF